MTAIKQLLTDAELERAATGGSEARALFKRMRNADLWVVEVALTFGVLAAGGLVAIVVPATPTQRIKLRDLVLSGECTAFSGGGGNRLVSVTAGTSVWTAITAALLGTPVATRWGGRACRTRRPRRTCRRSRSQGRTSARSTPAGRRIVGCEDSFGSTMRRQLNQ